MGQRHNRRRTRPGSRNCNSLGQGTSASAVTQVPSSPLAVPSSIWNPLGSHSEPIAASYNSPAACISPGSPVPAPFAPTWHNGYTAWQIRESTPLEASELEVEQCRLFGGEPGDDVSLCYRMLEYFGRLDYIDS